MEPGLDVWRQTKGTSFFHIAQEMAKFPLGLLRGIRSESGGIHATEAWFPRQLHVGSCMRHGSVNTDQFPGKQLLGLEASP